MKLKFYYKSILFIIGLLAVLFLSKDLVLKKAITYGGSRAIGTDMTIDSLSWSIHEKRLIVKGVKVYSPEGFGYDPMISISLMRMDYTPAALLQREPRIDQMILKVDEIMVVSNKEGELNINNLQLAQAENGERKDGEDGIVPVFPFEIARLKLSVGKVVHKDYAKGDPPLVRVQNIGIEDKEFNNVASARKLVALVLVNAVKSSTIKGVKVYALATLLGTSFLPAGVATMLTGKDHVTGEFNGTAGDVYLKALEVLKSIGQIRSENPGENVIEANVDGHQVFVEIDDLPEKERTVKITASARKFFMPKPKFAGGILYQLAQEL